LVTRDPKLAPAFLSQSTGGWFKRQDPTVPLAILEQNCVPSASVVYIGKGEGEEGLKQRLQQLLSFG